MTRSSALSRGHLVTRCAGRRSFKGKNAVHIRSGAPPLGRGTHPPPPAGDGVEGVVSEPFLFPPPTSTLGARTPTLPWRPHLVPHLKSIIKTWNSACREILLTRRGNIATVRRDACDDTTGTPRRRGVRGWADRVTLSPSVRSPAPLATLPARARLSAIGSVCVSTSSRVSVQDRGATREETASLSCPAIVGSDSFSVSRSPFNPCAGGKNAGALFSRRKLG